MTGSYERPALNVGTVKLEDEIDLTAATCRLPQRASASVAPIGSDGVWCILAARIESRVSREACGRLVKAKATQIRYRVDVNTLAHAPAHQLEMNSMQP